MNYTEKKKSDGRYVNAIAFTAHTLGQPQEHEDRAYHSLLTEVMYIPMALTHNDSTLHTRAVCVCYWPSFLVVQG